MINAHRRGIWCCEADSPGRGGSENFRYTSRLGLCRVKTLYCPGLRREFAASARDGHPPERGGSCRLCLADAQCFSGRASEVDTAVRNSPSSIDRRQHPRHPSASRLSGRREAQAVVPNGAPGQSFHEVAGSDGKRGTGGAIGGAVTFSIKYSQSRDSGTSGMYSPAFWQRRKTCWRSRPVCSTID